MNIIVYDDVIKATDLNDIVKEGEGVILYYPTTSEFYGHYIALTRHNGKIYFNDSYGYTVDSDKIKLNDWLYELEGKQNSLIKLLLTSGLDVDFSNYKHQRLADNVSTCGRWALLRVSFPKMSNDQFHKVISKAMKKYGVDGDTLVSIIVS